MRIAIFNWRCLRHPQAGGSEAYLYEQARRWAVQGHDVLWFTARPSGTSREENHDGIRFIRGGGTYTVYLFAALNYLRQATFDVILDVENGIPFFTPVYARVPVVLLIYHVHTDVWAREASWLTAKVGSWLERKVMPAIYRRKQIVTISPSSEEMIDRLFGEHRPIHLVYSGFSDELVPGSKAEQAEIVYLGRLRKYKSVDVLLRALHRLSDLSLTLRLAGQGEDEPRLRELAASLGLTNVIFQGYVDEDEKRKLLQRAWVVVNPSSMEGWGITNIEANACGTPVVGADVPGIRDSISPGQSGLLVPHGDDNALADAIRLLIEDDTRRNEMSRTACEWAARFSWQAASEAFMKILEQETAVTKESGDE
ncbi:MAG: glycosyltransferase family 4 protein [Kiritimatiellales bacterium]|nr:glycosyltransferase family 4 protein [Kiritimatiellales bacterium]